MAKTANDRLTDTMAYIKEKLSKTDHDAIDTLVKAYVDKTTLGNNLSIGNWDPRHKAARRAKRATMLMCQLFIEDKRFEREERTRVSRLAEGSEANILAELKSWFVKPGVKPADVAGHARRIIVSMPKWNNINYDAADAVRGVIDKTKPFNCYNACVFWAFQAGAISKRYLWNKLQGKDGNHFFPIYSQVGWETILEYSLDTKPPTQRVDKYRDTECMVPPGLTVYFETPSKVFGHVACSLGDGTVISQNSVIPAAWMKTPGLMGTASPEVTKMTQAITHIISIRELIGLHFFPENAYPKVKVSLGGFWEPIPLSER